MPASPAGREDPSDGRAPLPLGFPLGATAGAGTDEAALARAKLDGRRRPGVGGPARGNEVSAEAPASRPRVPPHQGKLAELATASAPPPWAKVGNPNKPRCHRW